MEANRKYRQGKPPSVERMTSDDAATWSRIVRLLGEWRLVSFDQLCDAALGHVPGTKSERKKPPEVIAIKFVIYRILNGWIEDAASSPSTHAKDWVIPGKTRDVPIQVPGEDTVLYAAVKCALAGGATMDRLQLAINAQGKRGAHPVRRLLEWSAKAKKYGLTWTSVNGVVTVSGDSASLDRVEPSSTALDDGDVAPLESPSSSQTTLGLPYSPVGRLPAPAKGAPFEVDPDVIDRGNQAHADTQDALAEFLRGVGISPRRPKAGEPKYDLAWEWRDQFFVAEVKSTTVSNKESQLRLGLGQVLRYRHEIARTGRQVIAVIVPESEPDEPVWAELCATLGVVLAWPGSFERVFGRKNVE
jgi:hypothetical protein